MRVRALRVAFPVVLVACNALTGSDRLSVGSEDEAPENDASAANPEKTIGAKPDASDAGEDAQPLPDAAPDEASTPDASVDAPVDSGPCVPTSVGPRYGSFATGMQWTERSGALAPDNSRAHTNGPNTNALITGGFGFSLPDSAEITGIRVVIARNAVGFVSDNLIGLPKGNTKANGQWPAGAYDETPPQTTYGSSTDLWGTTWTAADINASSFGVAMLVNGSGDGHVDSIGVTVYYCP